MAREMKNSSVKWIDVIPVNWQVKPLKTQFSFGKGLSITKADLVDEGSPVISYGQIHSKHNTGTNVTDDLIRFIPSTIAFNQSLVKHGDFIFADTSEDLDGCGNCVYMNLNTPIYAGYHTIILHQKSGNDDNRYLAYLFKTDCWRKQIRTDVNGVKLFSISQNILKRTNIILPPLPEQKTIADFLDKKCAEIDGLLADLEAEVKTLAEYKKSIIAETVTRGLNPNAPTKQSGIPWAETIPAHWVSEKFRYKLKVRRVTGQGDKQVLSVYREYGVVPKDSRDDNHNVTSEDTSKYKYVRPNDFVINKMKAWQGSMGVSDHEGIVSPAYFVYGFSDDDYNPRYFHYFMRNANNIPEYRRLSGGIREGQWDLSPYDLGNMPVIVPPKAEQNEIVAFLDEKCAAIEQSIADKQTQIETLKAYKSSLIYEYVTGKKQVI